jgi:hypothetical protein
MTIGTIGSLTVLIRCACPAIVVVGQLSTGNEDVLQMKVGSDEILEKIEKACKQSRLFNMFSRQGFWHAHHVDLVWRYNGKDVHEQADWLKDIWYLLKDK